VIPLLREELPLPPKIRCSVLVIKTRPGGRRFGYGILPGGDRDMQAFAWRNLRVDENIKKAEVRQ
jgi:hypothetical protein